MIRHPNYNNFNLPFLKNTLIVFLGPTAVGKTRLAIEVAEKLNAEIISADSRQFYDDLKIGTAAPDESELARVKHHFIGNLGLNDYYNVSSFEQDVIHFLQQYFLKHKVAVMVGGSGLYIDAVCKGIDDLPDPDEGVRNQLKQDLQDLGIESMRERLKKLDPEYYEVVDLNNPNRILRALEVCLMTGNTYTSLRKNVSKKRNFSILKIGLDRPREELFGIIHHRVDRMMEDGLLDEVQGLLPFRNENALNTVGYKELFNYLDETWSLDLAIEKIKTNTRRYAKRQLTWFKREKSIRWFHPDDDEDIMEYIGKNL